MTGLNVLLLLLALGVLVLLIKAALFRPAPEVELEQEAVQLDYEKAVRRLQGMIRIPTVSYQDHSCEDAEAFERFHAYLAEAYPLVTAHCPRTRHGRTGLLYHWPGRSCGQTPAVLMAHYDVVPARAEAWERQPFSADIVDGQLWGRGTLDTKATLCAILEAAEQRLAEGFVPEQDLYFSFSGDEETHGESCPAIVDYFKNQALKPRFVLDEGGAVVEGLFPGVKRPFAVVGVGEKGILDISLELESRGGHASAPKRHTAVGELCAAGAAIEARPFPLRLAGPVAELFDTLGRHASFPMRVVFANLRLFLPLLDWLTRRSGGELNALFRTTNALTQAEGSPAINVMPPLARLGVNLRTLPEDTEERVLAHLRRRCKNERIRFNVLYNSGMAPFSSTDNAAYHHLLGAALKQTWPEAIMTPYLMLAASDARHFARISDAVYRFSAMALSAEERGLIHGHNERLRLEEWKKTLDFYLRLIARL